MNWFAELLKEAILFLGLDHVKDVIRGTARPLIAEGLERYQKKLKQINEWRHELIGFIHTELPRTQRERIMAHWRRIERHDHKTYPDRTNFENNPKYVAGDEAIFTLVMTDHFRFLSGDAEEENRKTSTDITRNIQPNEKETRRKSFELIANLNDEQRDDLVLVMLNDQPKQLLERLGAMAKQALQPVSDSARVFAEESMRPINDAGRAGLNEFRAAIGLRPMSDGTPQPGETDFLTRVRRAWRGGRS